MEVLCWVMEGIQGHLLFSFPRRPGALGLELELREATIPSKENVFWGWCYCHRMSHPYGDIVKP